MCYLFLLPQILLTALFSLYPLVQNVLISFTEWTVTATRWVGLANYQAFADDPVLWTALRNTVLYTIAAVPLTMAVALVLAIGVNGPIRGRVVFRGIFLLPYLLSWVVVALVWQWMYSANYGLLNWFLEAMGMRPLRWLQNPGFALLGVAITTAWATAGFYMVIFLAGLQSIPAEYYEAAKIDGASAWGQFRYVTLPLLRPITLFVTVFAVTNSLRVFDLIWVMTGGGPGRSTMVMVTYIYERAFEAAQIGYASALSILLFLMILGCTLFQLRAFRSEDTG
jgi:multiple sugar transport system permease protein